MLLGNPVGKMIDFKKSGIYKIKWIDCDKNYVVQTGRFILIRFREHVARLRYRRSEIQNVAQQFLDN